MELDHQFDWHGFSFFVKFAMVCFMIGALGQVGFAMGQTYLGYATTATAAGDTRTMASAASTPRAESATLSESARFIVPHTITDAIPPVGKFIVADLISMRLTLYQDGTETASYPILTKGRPGSPYETPSGAYTVLTKEQNHLNKGEQVYMPYSMQFYGNYFIHGWPYFTDGTQVASTYSGGCIRLSTTDAAKVFDFASLGTGILVHDTGHSAKVPPLALIALKPPSVSAESYLVADIDTGDVFLERDALTARPIASVTKLVTALVANETIMYDKDIPVQRGILLHPQATTTPLDKVPFTVGDLLYPLLMESNNDIAALLAAHYGTPGFIKWMNTTAKSLNMTSTHFSDASGISPENVSTVEDLYRLAVYLTNKKAFIWNITRAPTKTLTAPNGSTFTFGNYNKFSHLPTFVGGKVGHTGQALHTMTSVFSAPFNGVQRRVAIIILRSTDSTNDTLQLAEWFMQSAEQGVALQNAACATCVTPPAYRRIKL